MVIEWHFTSTPGSMLMEVICFTISEGECSSIPRLFSSTGFKNTARAPVRKIFRMQQVFPVKHQNNQQMSLLYLVEGGHDKEVLCPQLEEVIKRVTRQERWRAFLQAGFWTAREFGQAWAAMTGEATIFTFLEEEPTGPLAVTGADLDARFLGALAGQSQPASHPGPLVSRFRALGSVEEGKLVAGPWGDLSSDFHKLFRCFAQARCAAMARARGWEGDDDGLLGKVMGDTKRATSVTVVEAKANAPA